MAILEEIYEKARRNPVRIAFPETKEEKILKAAAYCAEEKLCIPVLVGYGQDICESAQQFGIDLRGIEIADCSDEVWKEQLLREYAAYPSTLSEKAIRRKSKDPMNMALMMEAVGQVDVTFAGMAHTTGEVIYAGQMFIGLKEGVTTASSVAIAEIPGYQGSEGNLLAFGDSAVCANPTAEDLSSIAVSACDTVKDLMGWEPRCAMLSFSTDGSAENELVDKVREALSLAKEMRPEYQIDGEFQLDAAILPQIAEKKVRRDSSVAGKANILIWPDLNVGNIAVKLLQVFGHADAYGPLLQGFKKIVCDCSRSAPVSELVGNIAISAARAQGGKE